jgi:hypothetical protein
MSTKTEREIAEESLQRIIRTETRLMTLGTKLGFDLKDDEDISVVADSNSVYLASLDVPYTSVIKAARRAGLHKQKVSVFFNGSLVAEMPV